MYFSPELSRSVLISPASLKESREYKLVNDDDCRMSDANAGLDRLLDEAQKLANDYEEALERYVQGAESKRLLAGLVVDHFEIPEKLSSSGLKLFLQRWEATPESKALRARFHSTYDRVKQYLGTVSTRTKAVRWPGNSGRLLEKLKPVNDAVRTDTKIRRLVSALENIDLLDLTFNDDLPRRRPRQRSGTKSPAPHQDSLTALKSSVAEQRAWSLVAIFVTVVVTVTVGLGVSTSFGWFWAFSMAFLLGIVITVAVALTRPLWIRALGRPRRK